MSPLLERLHAGLDVNRGYSLLSVTLFQDLEQHSHLNDGIGCPLKGEAEQREHLNVCRSCKQGFLCKLYIDNAALIDKKGGGKSGRIADCVEDRE